jgi:malate dehydrogenase (oxaloacetate-decarboxylating)(NADP+)
LEAIKGADVFFGLSAGNVLSADMLLAMADNPVVFCNGKSVPEIDYHLRSYADRYYYGYWKIRLSNQVNNVLGFPIYFVVH